MKLNQLIAAATLVVSAGVAVAAQPSASADNSSGASPLKLVRTISLPADIKGHFDHLIVDVRGSRLFVTPEDYHSVLVIDLKTGKVIEQIKGIEKPHAILYRPDVNKLYVTDGTDGSLKVFNATTYAPEGRVPLLKDADSIGYDPASKYLYIDDGGGDVGQKYSMLSVVDTNTDKKIADIKINGDTLEAMTLDEHDPRMFVNDRALNTIAIVNRQTRQVIGSWPVTQGKVNVAMALDEASHRLFVACRSGQIVVMDTATGKELQALPIVKGVDDLAYDQGTKRLYAAADGAVSVYQQIDADHYRLLGNIPTGPLGKTARLSPELKRYFVAVPQHGTQSASVLCFETTNLR